LPASAVEIRGLRKSFPRFTLGPLDLTVPLGAIYGFVGPNGAGKTTTIDLIFGIGLKDAGSITVLGFDHLRDEVAMKSRVGYVSPDLSFEVWGRVRKAIHFVRGFYPTWDESYCARLMESFRLHGDDRIMTLSSGARTKLALLLALSWRPSVLILDEPTTGLDAISKRQVFGELLSAVREGDRSVLIASHALSDLERFADHIGMINNGRLLFEGTTEDLADRYRMVDFVAPEAAALGQQPGCVVQAREGDRWRVLFDARRGSLDELRQRGATLIAEAPVTLEELLVALGRR
jgi:ABC-2 type transport system ATP-binding protein